MTGGMYKFMTFNSVTKTVLPIYDRRYVQVYNF